MKNQKTKTKKNQVIVAPTGKKTIAKTKSTKPNLPTKKVKNTLSYYLCMGTNCRGQNIAKVAHDCKSNAPSLIASRTKKVKELARAAKVIGKFAQDLEKVLSH